MDFPHQKPEENVVLRKTKVETKRKSLDFYSPLETPKLYILT